MRAIVLGMMMLAATPAVAADQFDLVCAGQRKWSPEGRPEPVQARYRIDLKAGTWCRDKCTSIENISSFNEGSIILSSSDGQADSNRFKDHSINRMTGEWKDVFIFRGRSSFYLNAEGKCEPAEFSGFPAAKF